MLRSDARHRDSPSGQKRESIVADRLQRRQMLTRTSASILAYPSYNHQISKQSTKTYPIFNSFRTHKFGLSDL